MPSWELYRTYIYFWSIHIPILSKNNQVKVFSASCINVFSGREGNYQVQIQKKIWSISCLLLVNKGCSLDKKLCPGPKCFFWLIHPLTLPVLSTHLWEIHIDDFFVWFVARNQQYATRNKDYSFITKGIWNIPSSSWNIRECVHVSESGQD